VPAARRQAAARPVAAVAKQWRRPYAADVSDPWGQQYPGDGQQPPPNYPPPGYPPPGYPGYGYPGYGYRPPGPPPSSQIGWAVVALLFCWPLAIPAFIYSSRVESAWYRGDVDGARRASDNARTCGIVALVIGIVATVLLLAFVGAVFSSVSSP
jgi:hypothetical protein